MSRPPFFDVPEDKIQAAAEHFRVHRWVAVPDFCHPDVAERMHAYLLSPAMPKEQWFHASQYAGAPGTQYLEEVPKNLPGIVENRRRAQARGAGVLNYSFTRTLISAADAQAKNPTFHQFYALLTSERFLDVASRITGFTMTGLETLFASKYVTGDFLDAHTDAAPNSPRHLAFVLNLTRDWQDEYGGLLHIGGRALVPGFNTLMLFDVRTTQDRAGQLHYVSEVTDKTNETRLAVSGWLNGKSDASQ
jgi:SM-20-related protein